MLLSIVICTYNRSNFLDLGLNAIMQQINLQKDSDIEMLVIDNNSIDSTRQIVEKYKVIFLEIPFSYHLEPQQGISYSRNNAITNSNGKFIAFIDDDAVVNDNWLTTLLNSILKIDAHVFGGPIYPRFEIPCPKWIDPNYFVRTFKSRDGLLKSLAASEGFPGGNVCFKKDIFDHIGMFDPNYGMSGNKMGLGEEPELFNRLYNSNYNANIYNLQKMSISHFESSKKFEKSYLKERIKLSGYQFTNRMLAQSKFVGSISVFLKLVKQFLFSIVYLLQIPFIEKCKFKFLKCIWLISGLLKGFF